MIDIKEVFLQWLIIFFDKKAAGGVATLANESAIKKLNYV